MLANRICRKLCELAWEKFGSGGGELIVMSALIVVYGQAWLTFGGSVGLGWKARSNGCVLGSEGRYSISLMMSQVDVCHKYPMVESAGVTMEAKPSWIELWMCISLVNLY